MERMHWECRLLIDGTELDHINGDVTFTDAMGERATTARRSLGIDTVAPGQRKCGIEFEMLYSDTDVGLAAVLAAYAARRVVAVTTFGKRDGLPGPSGDMYVMSAQRKEPAGDGNVTYAIVLKPAYSESNQYPG